MYSSSGRQYRRMIEHPIREPVLPHGLPDVFLAVEFGCARRQRHQRDVARDLERLGAMPAGLIEEDDRVRAGRDLVAISSR